MPRQKPSLVAFNAGEFGAEALARVDLEQYLRGAEMMENMLPLVQGGMEKHPGILVEARAKSDEGDIVLRPFIFSEEQSFTLELTDNQMGFYYLDEGQVVADAADQTVGIWNDDSGEATTGGDPPPSGSGSANVGIPGGGFGGFGVGSTGLFSDILGRVL